MGYASLPQIRPFLEENRSAPDYLPQNQPMEEGRFISFLRERGLSVGGPIKGDASKLAKLGLIEPDAEDDDSRLYFHPFRICQFNRIQKLVREEFSTSMWLSSRERIADIATQFGPTEDTLHVALSESTAMVDLAILLEPIFWQDITGRLVGHPWIPQEELSQLFSAYKARVFGYLRSLRAEDWRMSHADLCREAHAIDSNTDTYILLRSATWNARQGIVNGLGAALWLRHVAEVIRRGFEAVTETEWREESSRGMQSPEGTAALNRRRLGSERPLDAPLTTARYLLPSLGLFTGSVVRWYVEGDTEYYAIRELIPQADRLGFELVNLRGSIRSGKNNIAVTLQDCLRSDIEQRRFSMITIDKDVETNLTFLRKQIEAKVVIGTITVNDPDFEFANFTLAELVTAAADLEDSQGRDGSPLRNADWGSVSTARAFEERYRQLSSGGRRLKGEAWGLALGKHAKRNHQMLGTQTLRPIHEDIRSAYLSRVWDYDFSKEKIAFDKDTFKPPTADQSN